MRIESMEAYSRDIAELKVESIPKVQAQHENTCKISEQNLGTIPSEKTVINAIENANKAIIYTNRQLAFSIHEKTKEIMVKVIDAETKEVIREIPPEKTLDMVAKMMELAGILVDERR